MLVAYSLTVYNQHFSPILSSSNSKCTPIHKRAWNTYIIIVAVRRYYVIRAQNSAKQNDTYIRITLKRNTRTTKQCVYLYELTCASHFLLHVFIFSLHFFLPSNWELLMKYLGWLFGWLICWTNNSLWTGRFFGRHYCRVFCVCAFFIAVLCENIQCEWYRFFLRRV